MLIKTKKCKILAFALFLAMILSSLSIGMDPVRGICVSAGNVAYAEEISSRDYIQDGTILQAFCWSFNTIRDNMPDIAAAGYTAIQTSPVQDCLDTNPLMTIGGSGHWYYHYQPTDYTIGNYQLGTEAEFQEMCAVAESYGVKVIVDVVPNHTTPVQAEVSENLINAVGGVDNLYHDTGLTNCSDYADRLQCTRYQIGGLPDIDTENPDYQNYFINFLNQCIADGADGFRYDSAKHIGAPDDPVPDGVVNNFWNRVTTEITNAGDIFNYGEVLQGANDRLEAFEDVIGGTTASAYGASIRTALASNNFLVSNILDYGVDSSVNPDNLVTWVESHDNYYNDGTWSLLDNSQVDLGWAIIAARANGTPLFFSRPYGSSTTNEYGTNTIGIAGDDNYKDDQVIAVNNFRKEMAEEPENLTNPEGNSKVLMIERGTKGVVIVNGNSGNYPLDAATNLADGTYVNHTDDNSVFTVVNGVISGVLPGRSAVVLYGAEATNSTTVHFYNGNHWVTVYSSYPGTQATSDRDGWWRVTVPADVNAGFTISFNDGAGSQTGDLTVNDPAKLYYTSLDATAYASKADAEAALGVVKTAVHFFNSSSWRDVSAYIWGPGELFGGWPGVAARNDGDGWWTVDIPSAPLDNLHIIFNNCNNGSQSADFVINDSTNVYVTNANDKKYTSKLEAMTDLDMVPGTTVAYFYNHDNWPEVCAYTWGAVNFGPWPGVPATDVGGGWWKISLPANPSMELNLIFNNNNNGSQTANLLVSNITNRYFSTYNATAYPSKEAVEALFASTTTTSVYFYNNSGWSTVNAYLWGDRTNGSWPGQAATEVENGWWKYDIPAAPSSNLHVIFNGGGQQRDFAISDSTHVYVTNFNDTKYTSIAEAEAANGVNHSATTVYFYNSDNWSSVNAYATKNGVDVLGAYPGTPVSVDSGNWYKIVVPTGASSNLVVSFNDGNGNESDTFTVSDTAHVFYTLIANTGYVSKIAAEVALGVAPTSVTVHFYNNDNWPSVSAYVYGPGELLGGWPGTAASNEGNGWWKVTVPAPAYPVFHVIFNNSGAGSQSPDYTIDDYTNVYVTNLGSIKYASKAAALGLSSDATLSSLSVDGAVIAGFSPDILEYSVVLPHGTTVVPAVTGIANSGSATVAVNSASALPGTTNVVVTAQDGETTRTYAVNFTVALNSDATLKDIKVNGVLLKNFTPDTMEYKIVLPNSTKKVPTVTAEANDTNAAVVTTAAGNIPGTTVIAVTAEDGITTDTYKLNFTLEKYLSKDATLSDLKVDGTTIAGFSSNKYCYEVVLPRGTTIVPVVSAVVNDSNANAVVTNCSKLPGITKIVVTAEDGRTKNIYTILFRAACNNDATLKEIKVNGILIEDFSPDKEIYQINLPKSTNTAPKVTATPNDPTAKVLIVPSYRVPGFAIIGVVAEDLKTIKTYTIYFSKG